MCHGQPSPRATTTELAHLSTVTGTEGACAAGQAATARSWNTICSEAPLLTAAGRKPRPSSEDSSTANK